MKSSRIVSLFGVLVFAACGSKHLVATPPDGGGHDGAGAAGSGAPGSAGATGTVGSAGTSGNPGVAGTSGAAGFTGQAGTTGAAGKAGIGGTSGAAGAGIAGTSGSAGNAGVAGTPGAAGNAGYVPTVPITMGDKPFTNPSNVSGTWTGYFENVQFPSGSDSLVLKFGKDAQGQTTLRVVMGEGQPPPAATDPTRVWPPTLDPQFGAGADEIEGFEYPAHEVRWQGQRLQFKLAIAEAWTPWCSMQTSYKLSGGNGFDYNCVPGSGGSYSNNECTAQDGDSHTVVPCGQFFMCSGRFCTCNATGCGPVVDHDRNFDITFNSANLASGSGYVSAGLRNVHLMSSSN